LIDEAACAAMEQALGEAAAQGGRVIAGGGRVRAGNLGCGFYMQPALVEISADAAVVQRETFAPILYLHRYSRFEEAVVLQNGVSQGLSSALFSESLSATRPVFDGRSIWVGLISKDFSLGLNSFRLAQVDTVARTVTRSLTLPVEPSALTFDGTAYKPWKG
jgi:aldehyde dehydrogenase (NAD+)